MHSPGPHGCSMGSGVGYRTFRLTIVNFLTYARYQLISYHPRDFNAGDMLDYVLYKCLY